MEKVVFRPEFENIFRANNLNSFEDFFNFKDGTTVDKNNKRSVLSFSLDSSAGRKHFFMKRFEDPHFKDMYFAFKNYGPNCSQGRLEWENANYLINNGINAYKPVVYGQHTVFGFEAKSFMITEELPGECLTDYIRKTWNNTADGEKIKILSSLHSVVARARSLHISLRDLYLWHFFIDRKADGFDFYLLDLHRMKINARSRCDLIRDYAALYYSMNDELFTEEQKKITILGDAVNFDKNLWNKILTRAAKIKSRRGQPRY